MRTIVQAALIIASIATPITAKAGQKFPQEIPAVSLLELNHAGFISKIAGINNNFLKISKEIDLQMIYHEMKLLEIEKAYANLEECHGRIDKALRHARELFRIPRVLSRTVLISDFIDKYLYFCGENQEALKEHFNEEFKSIICLSDAVMQLLSEDEEVREEVEDRTPMKSEALERIRIEIDQLRKSARQTIHDRVKELLSIEIQLENIHEDLQEKHKSKCPVRYVLGAVRTNVSVYTRVLSIVGSSAELIGPSWRILLEDALYDTLFTNLLFEENLGEEIVNFNKIATEMKKGKLRRFIEKLVK